MRKLILICAALVLCYTASAQEVNEVAALNTKVTEIDTRLAKNEKRTALLEKIKQYIKVSAFFQGQYDWVDDRKGDDPTGTSTFHLRRLRFTVAGDLYRGAKGSRLDYRVYFDLVRIKNPNPNPILDLWIRYKPIKEFGIQFGQFKNPITFEASLSPSTYEFIDYSYAVGNLAKMSANDVAGLNVTARDAGFQIFGGFIHRDGYSILNYNIGVLNGNGINAKDNNKSKDVFAKLTIQPIKDLSLAAYYQWGEANLSGLSEEKYADYGWNGNPEYVTMHRWGGGFKYDTKQMFARGEYIAGTTGALVSEGMYIEAGKRFNLPKNKGMIWAGGMVDYFCRSCGDYIIRDTKNANIDMRYTVCVGYTPFRYLRVQLAYSLEHRIHHTFENNRHFGNSVKLMVTGAF